MAHSMAAKLNDSEINAIISMTEKLRSKEKQVALMMKEKEEMEGKLSGSEAVKDFLITKVRDMEKIMNKSDETEKKVTQQIASDQEVIAFLDGRVQELEQQTRVIQKEKSSIQEKLKSVIAQNEKKTAVLSDMLQFERQKVKENEREWKATKKLLVKEVKGCRAQILALQAERDGFREQNDALRKAVMASGSGGSAHGN
jgi:chromosome segregation ATPase